MEPDKKGLSIIFHSSSFDRVYHGMTIALAGSALGRDVRLFFTYWALEYLRRKRSLNLILDEEANPHRRMIEKNIARGHILKIGELFKQAKAMKVKFYACTNSMGILNIARDELITEADKSMGLTTFLTETVGYQILFI